MKNEIRVRKCVAEKCGSVLKDLPKSLLEDRVILQDIDKLQDPELPLEQAQSCICAGGAFAQNPLQFLIFL